MLSPGDTLAGYRIDAIAGHGGMGVVYRATQLSLDRTVALKVLATTLVGNRTFRERFRREGRHAATLEHPNIIPVYEAGESNGLMFIAMRFVDGPTLSDLMQSRRISGREALRMLSAIASALDAAHEAGLVHRDVKPQNILLTSGGHPYLADFGITKGSATGGLTHTGDFVGSLSYVSPEQIDGTDVSPASDIYSLAAVLFQCLTGELPFDRETDAALMHAHLFAPPPRVSTLGVDVPQALDEVFARGMAKQPADRFESARELIGACRSALATVRPATLDRSPAFPRPEQEAQEELPATPREPQVPTASATPGDDARRDAEPSISARLTQAPWPATAAPEPERLKAATDAGPRIARRSRAIGWPAALVVALLLAAVVGYLLGSGSKRSDPRPLKRIAVGSISLAAPAGWTAADEQVSGLDLTDRISLRHSSGVVLVAGRLSSFAPGLDPSQPALRARFRTARKQLVSIAGRSAVTYAGDRRDGGSAWIALLPDSRGWTAAGCSSVAREPRLRTLCARVAGTLSASDAKPVALGPDPSLAKALNSGVGELNSGRARLVARLRVRSTALRAKAAAQLATVYASVATGLERATVRVQDRPLVTDLVRALRREAAAFRQLAGAAKRRQRRTYALTRDRVSSAAREARQALARLDRGGYR